MSFDQFLDPERPKVGRIIAKVRRVCNTDYTDDAGYGWGPIIDALPLNYGEPRLHTIMNGIPNSIKSHEAKQLPSALPCEPAFARANLGLTRQTGQDPFCTRQELSPVIPLQKKHVGSNYRVSGVAKAAARE